MCNLGAKISNIDYYIIILCFNYSMFPMEFFSSKLKCYSILSTECHISFVFKTPLQNIV